MTNETAKRDVHLKWLSDLCKRQAPETEIDLSLFNGDITHDWDQAKTLLGYNDIQLSQEIASQFGLSIVPSLKTDNQDLLKYVPYSVASRYLIFPVAIENQHLIIASANPADQEMISVLGFLSSLYIEICIAPPDTIQKAIDAFYEPDSTDDDELIIQAPTSRLKSSSANDTLHQESAIVEMVSTMLLEAFNLNASDIHIEPFKEGGVIRYRVDGLLSVVTELPLVIFNAMIQRIKAISSMNIANKLIPQDGSASIIVNGQAVDLRVSTIPVKGGEKAVIRLLIQSIVKPIDQIGLSRPELEKFKEILNHNSGVFIITGPTGSGKSTTLYSALKELNHFDKCLVTVEDPIEYKIEGIAQINVNTAQQLTFNTALKHILRQDPDVILVGEVRDNETAETCFKAAITGHFVMSTLHTNNAVTTLPRLIGLGISETLIADSLKGVAAQRLVRKLCPHCATTEVNESHSLSQRYLKLIQAPQAIKVAKGCDVCRQTGYQGRVPIFEIIYMNDSLKQAIRNKTDITQLKPLLKLQGFRSMSDIAIELISEGQTSVEEVDRVLGQEFWDTMK